MSRHPAGLARALEEYQEAEALRIAALESDGRDRNARGDRAARAGTVRDRAAAAGPAEAAARTPEAGAETEAAGAKSTETREGENEREHVGPDAVDADAQENHPDMVLEQLGARNELVERFSTALRAPEDDEYEDDGEHLLPRFWLRKGVPMSRRSAAAGRDPQQQQQRQQQAQQVEKRAAGGGILVEHDAHVEDEEDPADLGEWFEPLPRDALLRVLYFLDEDALDLLRVCNPAWHEELLSESLWRHVCERVFVPPAFRPMRVVESPSGALAPRKFETWERARRLRPRVRMETGVYILQSTYVRAAGPRTLWSPEDYKAVLEIKHYRYLLFKPDGQVLYASTPLPPSKMRSKIREKLFEDWVHDGFTRHVEEANEETDEGADSGAQAVKDGTVPAQPKPVERMSRRKRAEHLRQQRQMMNTSRADVIHSGLYTVSGGVASVVINLVKYTVTFDLKLHPRGGSHDILQTVKHQSVYHKDGERVVDYDLSNSMLERLWSYYAFSDPSDPS